MRIYVGNFVYETTEQDMREAFEAYGAVEEVTIIRDRDTGRSRGFGFVEMPTSEEATTAIAGLNGKDMGGRTLAVNEAKARTEGGGGGGGRGPRW